MSTTRVIKPLLLVLAALFLLVSGQSALASDSECVNCHTNSAELAGAIDGLPSPQPVPAHWGTGPLAPQSRVERVLVSQDFMDDENHGSLGCEECHQGDASATDFAAAHQGLVRDPSYPAPGVCADCHDQGDNYESSLHYNLHGMSNTLKKRMSADPDKAALVQKGFDQNCATCHSSCGQCHVSRPAPAGGGLVKGHTFNKLPDTENNCLACHGRGLGDEWLGDRKGRPADAHLDGAGMKCYDCHTAEEMHGDGTAYEGRYQMAGGPACLDCHQDTLTDKSENKKVHAMHKDRVTCQVCHAQPYNNCSGCHVKDGGGYELAKTWYEFKIGRNPQITEKRPEKFVTVRRVPVEKDTFKAYTPDGLANFDQAPNWVMATPHNIRRSTPQNRDCNSCHGNWKLFLMRQDVEKENHVANRPVIVPPADIPALIKEDKTE